MRIARVDTVAVEIPQQYPIAPYQSRYRAQSSKKALLARLETDTGLVGWGETPQRYLGDQFTGLEAVELREKLVGLDPTALEVLAHDLELGGEHLESAVEMAMWDLIGRICGQPLYRLLGGPYRTEIELAACMGIRPPDEAAEIAQLYVDQGFSTLKTKAGRDVQEDLAMVRAIRDAVGDRLRLRIDPNMGYQPAQTLLLARALEPCGLEYLEQPMPAELIEASAQIRRQTRTPLALNESVTTLAAVRTILDKEAAAVLLPDTYQSGGLRTVQQIGLLAESAGVPCVFHCAHDLGLKTAAMLHVCAATANFSQANDCTYYGLADDVLTERIAIDRGHMRVPQRPGLGVEVDAERVCKYQTAGTL